MSENRLIELITKKISGDLSQDELRELENLANKSPELKATYQTLLNQWDNASKYKAGVDPRTQESWNRFEPKTRKSNLRVLPMILRVAAILVLAAGLGYYLFPKADTAITYSTGPNEKLEVKLPDGTSVLLNQNSMISYNDDFNRAARLTDFYGEAFFDVARDEKRPFRIQAKNATVEVLGTSFDVKADSEMGGAEVNVSTGRVAFRHNRNGGEVILEKGMHSILSSEGEFITTTASPNINYWRTQRLDFDDSSLADVITDLEKSFNKSIAFDPEKLGQCRFTGSFQDPALDEVLEIISATMNLTVETTATGFAMRGEGCNQF